MLLGDCLHRMHRMPRNVKVCSYCCKFQKPVFVMEISLALYKEPSPVLYPLGVYSLLYSTDRAMTPGYRHQGVDTEPECRQEWWPNSCLRRRLGHSLSPKANCASPAGAEDGMPPALPLFIHVTLVKFLNFSVLQLLILK